MHSTVFDQMANMVLARDLQSPLGLEFDADMTCNEAWMFIADESLSDSNAFCDRISLVKKASMPVGWIGLDMLLGDELISSCMDPIEPHTILSADTTALELVDLFGESQTHYFFVLDHNVITGTVHYTDLFGLPFRLCLFALTLGLENSALNLLLCAPGDSWDCLSEARKAKAVSVYKLRYGGSIDPCNIPVDRLLGCTMFCDKGKILKRRRILSDVPGSRLESVFSMAERVRNACAHIDLEAEYEKALVEREQLKGFIADIRSTTSAIELALANANNAVH